MDDGRHAAPMLPARLRRLFPKLDRLADELHEGTIEPDQARACIAVARAIVTVLQVGELEERIQAIERRMGLDRGHVG